MTATRGAGSAAFFSIYDPRRYAAFDNAAFADDASDAGGGGSQASRGGTQRVPYLRPHLPPNAASASSVRPADDDSLDDNAVLETAAPPGAPGPSGRSRWAAAAAATAPERRPTLLRMAETAAAKRSACESGNGTADLSELLSRGLQRQRESQPPVRTEVGEQPRHQQPQQQSPQFPRNASVRHATWWRGAILEHLNSRAGHHYFNGERDPAAVARATVRGSLVAYRRGPRPDVIGYFDHQQSQQPSARPEPALQSTRM